MTAELSPGRLFRLVLEEAYKDGVLSGEETELLQRLQNILGVNSDSRERMETEVLEKFEAGKLGAKRPLSRARLFEKCLAGVIADGEISDQERKLVDALGRMLRISQEEHKACMARVKQVLAQARAQQRPGETTAADSAPPAIVEAGPLPVASPAPTGAPPPAKISEVQPHAPPPSTAMPVAHPTAPVDAQESDSEPAASPPDPFDELLAESSTLADKWSRSGLPPADVGRVVELAGVFRKAYATAESSDDKLAGALCNLAGPLAAEGWLPELEKGLETVLARPSAWAKFDETYEATIANAILAIARAKQLGGLYPAVEMTSRLAMAAPHSEAAWRGLAHACQGAGNCLARGRAWEPHGKIYGLLQTIPPSFFPATDPFLAQFLADGVVFALSTGTRPRALQSYEALKKLMTARSSDAVVRQLAQALSCLIDPEAPQAENNYDRTAAQIDELVALCRSHPQHVEAARSLATSTAPALICFQVAKDEARLKAFGPMMVELAKRFPEDRALAFTMAKAIVNGAIVRTNMKKEEGAIKNWMSAIQGALGGASDPVLELLRATLEALIGMFPKSDDLADARGRFERTTGLAVSTPPGAKPAAPPPSDDVEKMRAAFGQMQKQGPSGPGMKAMQEVLGTGGYLPRVMRDGEKAYKADEWYFLHLLKEIATQIQADRSGFWAMNADRLELMTRYMVEDATPRIAQAANDIRKLLKLPEA